MTTRSAGRRFQVRFAALAALVLAGLLLGPLVSTLRAQEGDVPDRPRGLIATATHGQVVLSWDDPNDDSISGYVILRRVRVNDTGGDFDVLVADTGTAALTYTDDTVAAGLTYTYRIKAINEHGVSERSRWFHIDTPAAPVPDKPRGLEATASHGQVVLTWDDPQDASITGYVILRRIPGVDPQGQFSELVSNTGTDATTYTDDTVSAETRYTYRIQAINGAGTSERSRWSHIDVPAAPAPEPPDKPSGLSATATHDQVVLTWDDRGDDSITGYVILRRIPGTDPKGHFNVLTADTGSAATTYTDDTVAAETRYTYRIQAINGAGTSERSRWSHIDVPAAPEPTPAASHSKSEYIDAHNAGVHDLAALMDGTDPLDPDAWDTEEQEERVAVKQGKSVGTQQNRSSHTVDICDRTPEVEAALLAFIADSGQTVTCSTVTAAQLASVKDLYIEDGYSSQEIVASDFAGLTGLINLSISGSSELTTVPANAFSELRSTSFESLALPRNRIKTVHRDAFDGLIFSRMGQINLDFNDIEILEPGTFDGVTGLEVLILDGNHIKAFEDGFFKDLTDLKVLAISSNRIREIDGDMLRGLSSLQVLRIAGNGLSTLHPDAFDHLSALERLDLLDNDITELPADIFADVPDSLWEIRLSSNKISSLDPATFADLTGLRALELENNELSGLPDGVFDGLTGLQRLYLHGNSFATLDEDLFDGLTNLQQLYLYSNSLASLDENLFDGLTALQQLYLYDNGLTSLHKDLFDGLAGLQQLYLHGNSLASLDADIFDPLDDSLTDLALSDNDFSSTSLPADVFDGLTGLKRLYLHRSGLASLDQNLFDGLTGLQGSTCTATASPRWTRISSTG